MPKQYDLFIVGTGAAATSAAYRAREADWSVGIVDSRPYGGTCQLRGCDPKKVLVGVAQAVDHYNRLGQHGTAGSATMEWPAAMAFKDTFVRDVPAEKENAFRQAGVETYHGRASFIDQTSLAIGDDEVRAGHILIAAGSQPVPLGIDGEEHITTSDEFLKLPELPDKILFVGGGYISFEFAYLARQAGAEVRILERGSRPLKGFDPDLVDLLIRATEERGIHVVTEAEVQAVEAAGSSLTATAKWKGSERTFEADLVVHGAGRVPELDQLVLDRGHVDRNVGGVSVNAYLQSVSNPNVYAAGDAADSAGMKLTPVAGKEGALAVRNMLDGNQHTLDYTGTASVVFTEPAMAMVGLTEAQAREQGLPFDVRFQETGDWYTQQQSRVQHSGFKTIIHKETNEILGAHLFSPHAEDVINLFSLAMRSGIKADELKRINWAYPTPSSDIQYMV